MGIVAQTPLTESMNMLGHQQNVNFVVLGGLGRAIFDKSTTRPNYSDHLFNTCPLPTAVLPLIVAGAQGNQIFTPDRDKWFEWLYSAVSLCTRHRRQKYRKAADQ